MEKKKGYTEEYKEKKWRERHEKNSAEKKGKKVKEKA